jgi:hypothetical protein
LLNSRPREIFLVEQVNRKRLADCHCQLKLGLDKFHVNNARLQRFLVLSEKNDAFQQLREKPLAMPSYRTHISFSRALFAN